jgi:hypothetical protein
MKCIPRTRTSGIFADGPFVAPVVVSFLTVLALFLWVTYKAVM